MQHSKTAVGRRMKDGGASGCADNAVIRSQWLAVWPMAGGGCRYQESKSAKGGGRQDRGANRSIVKQHFPQALIVADRFHVIRLINHHFLACWREINPAGSKNRGLLSLMRRHRHHLKPEQKVRLLAYLAEHPALNVIYRFKQRLCYLLLKRHKTRRQCQKLIPRFLRAICELRQSGLAQLVTLGDPLHSWSEEIARIWRFIRNNGITEGFHNKMETISRQAYGFRNFENYRLRVQVLCA